MDRRIRNIVVGIADLQQEDPQLAPAIALAEQLGAALHVVHGFHLPDPNYHPYPEISALSPDALRQLQEGVQSRLERRVRAMSASPSVRCRAIPGPPAQAVTAVADEVAADLILVGATRRGKLGQAILGTTAQRVVRSASTPVLVLRRSQPHPLRRVLLATDLSEASAAACEQGVRLVHALDSAEAAEFRFLLVLGFDVTLPPPLSRGALGEAALGELDLFLESLGQEARGREASVRTGDPAEEILAAAQEWDADLLILGTHGRSGLSRMLIGSVAESVVRRASVNVLVIPAAGIGARRHEPSDHEVAAG